MDARSHPGACKCYISSCNAANALQYGCPGFLSQSARSSFRYACVRGSAQHAILSLAHLRDTELSSCESPNPCCYSLHVWIVRCVCLPMACESSATVRACSPTDHISLDPSTQRFTQATLQARPGGHRCALQCLGQCLSYRVPHLCLRWLPGRPMGRPNAPRVGHSGCPPPTLTRQRRSA